VNDLPFAARDLIDIHSYKYTLGDVPTTTHYTQYGCPYACLSADTLINLYRGGYTRLDNICVGDYLLNTDGMKSLVTAKAETSEKEAYQLELENGLTIRGSADHPVMTKRGWVKISELKENDEVLVNNAEESFGGSTGSSTPINIPMLIAQCHAKINLLNKDWPQAGINSETETP